jgi:hypothetical protein
MVANALRVDLTTTPTAMPSIEQVAVASTSTQDRVAQRPGVAGRFSRHLQQRGDERQDRLAREVRGGLQWSAGQPRQRAVIAVGGDADADANERRRHQAAGDDPGDEVLPEAHPRGSDLAVEDLAEQQQQDDLQRDREDHVLALPRELLDLDDPADQADPAERGQPGPGR